MSAINLLLRALFSSVLGVALIATVSASRAESASTEDQAGQTSRHKMKKTAAKPKHAKSLARAKVKLSSKPLQREVVFDGSTVSGQYHSAGEGVTKVEQEKKMNDLIGMRRDFKDRLVSERQRLKSGTTAQADTERGVSSGSVDSTAGGR